MKKKIALFLSMMLMLLPLTMLSVSAEYNSENDMTYIQIAQNWAEAYMNFPLEQLEEYKAVGAIQEEQIAILDTWSAVSEAVGANPQMSDGTVQLVGEDVKVVVPITGESGTVYFVANFDSSINVDELMMTGQMKAAQFTLSLDDNSGNMSSKMKNAALNTLMGMGSVFLILILISGVIYTLKFIPIILDKMSGKELQSVGLDSDKSPVINNVSTVSQDNSVLVAVIAAAAAAMSDETGRAVTADQLIVRSIKRANKR